jgi:Family of unknown function (DUF5329)
MAPMNLAQTLFTVLIFLTLATPRLLLAQALDPAETQKIETLINQVRALKDARFIRNGSSYSADYAAIFLSRKWQANQSNVKTARDFIDKVASFSGTTNKPYLIRFKDGREIKSREFFLAELNKIEKAREEQRAGGG